MGPRVCVFICLLSFVRPGIALLCYSRPCQPSANNICITLCPSDYSSCKMTVLVEPVGQHTVTIASCSQSNENCATEPGQCNLERKKESSCCCKTDYCNGGYRDANELYPFLTVSRMLPLLPLPPALATGNE